MFDSTRRRGDVEGGARRRAAAFLTAVVASAVGFGVGAGSYQVVELATVAAPVDLALGMLVEEGDPALQAPPPVPPAPVPAAPPAWATSPTPSSVQVGPPADASSKVPQHEAALDDRAGAGGDVHVLPASELTWRRRVPPVYPIDQRDHGHPEVRCAAEVEIDPAGLPRDVVVEGCSGPFAHEVLTALMASAWYPPRRQGHPVWARTRIAVRFVLR